MYPNDREFRYKLEEFSVLLDDLKVDDKPVAVDVTYDEDQVYAVWDEFGNEREFYELHDSDRKLINDKLQDILALRRLEANGVLDREAWITEHGIEIA